MRDRAAARVPERPGPLPSDVDEYRLEVEEKMYSTIRVDGRRGDGVHFGSGTPCDVCREVFTRRVDGMEPWADTTQAIWRLCRRIDGLTEAVRRLGSQVDALAESLLRGLEHLGLQIDSGPADESCVDVPHSP